MAVRDQLSMAFAALADPTRRDILARLRSHSLTVGELAAHYPMSRPAISQHLTVLQKAGLVTRDRRSQWNDCSVERSSLDEAAEWIEQQRRDWNARFDRLDEHLARRCTREHTTSDTTEGETP